MESTCLRHLQSVREKNPLVQSITNYVAMNNSANALLALGASPIMAHAQAEVKDMVKIVGALVINIGTLDEYWVESMLMAAQAAQEYGTPWVLDPVGAGATPYRDKVLRQLLSYQPNIIRGNASEILALNQSKSNTKGVDSTDSAEAALEAGKSLSQQHKTVICISGATDFVIQAEDIVKIENGDPMMAKVTGMGCTASALVGAFAAIGPAFEAAYSAMTVMGVSGELAAGEAKGPGSLQMHFYDALYRLDEQQLINHMKVSRL
ncbi:hydroxyethylthiazole kinase [Pararhodonellum marinum]|uniref:hydroxyethylthiazole kinase n=1 Tax=Pararhodonellum marinum TaxID=2755358 RepID=UPI00188EE8A3|nr:hydroxyethylthiazole kinase [Pararhodonellum marinum]